MLKSVETAAKHKEACLNNSKNFELFASCNTESYFCRHGKI